LRLSVTFTQEYLRIVWNRCRQPLHADHSRSKRALCGRRYNDLF
jgi:hypothetical protein